MRILYLCHRIPFPPNKGDKIRSFNEVKYLAERHEVDLICLADEPGDMKYQADLETICSRVAVFPLNKVVAKVKGLVSLAMGQSISAGYFYQKQAQAVCDRWIVESNYDAVVCFSSSMAEYVFRSRVMAGTGKRPKLIMDFCDVDSDKWIQYAEESRFPLSLIYRMENRRLADYERRICQAFDHSVLISQAEAELFEKVCPGAETVAIIPNGVDFEFFQPRTSAAPEQAQRPNTRSAPTLVFTGAMDYHANLDGVCWFCKEIWPQLKQVFPELQFKIVGSNPTPVVRSLGTIEGITVTGFVDDIRPYYQAADVCVIPLRLARGVQNKVLESMAMGKAVVTTSKANAGIQAAGGEHLLVADTPEAFVEAVSRLLNDRESRASLGQKARAFVVANYDWRSNMEKLERLLP